MSTRDEEIEDAWAESEIEKARAETARCEAVVRSWEAYTEAMKLARDNRARRCAEINAKYAQQEQQA